MNENEIFTKRKCQPCEGMGNPLAQEKALEYLRQVDGWHISEDGLRIFREYVTKNFLDAVEVIKKIAKIAETEGHHPDIHLTGYKKLRIDLSTHAIGGLSENDFIIAAKINTLSIT